MIDEETLKILKANIHFWETFLQVNSRFLEKSIVTQIEITIRFLKELEV